MQGLGKSLGELSRLVGKLRLEKQELQQRASASWSLGW